MLDHQSYQGVAQEKRHANGHAKLASAPRVRPQSRGMGDVAQGESVSRDQATALIERARRLLADARDGTAAVHLQDAINALEGKPSRQAERDMIVQFELRHRFRNIVAVTQSLVSQTLRPGAALEDARERLTERLAAMGAAVDLLLGAEWEPSPLDAIVRAGLAHYADHRDRIHCKGPDVMIGSNAVISLTLALHELETNAIKYGALSVPDGHVDLAWSLVGSDSEAKLWLQWCERGGPTVRRPERQGFGTRLVSGAIGRLLRAEVQLEYLPSGVTWCLIAPLSVIGA